MNACISDLEDLSSHAIQARIEAENAADDDDAEDVQDLNEADDAEYIEEDCADVGEDDNTTVTTTLGKMNIKKAERIFLNQGGFKATAKGRSGRIKGKKHVFSDNLLINFSKKKPCCPASSVKLGDRGTFTQFTKKGDGPRVTGEVAFLTEELSPRRFVCSKHHPGATIWVWSKKQYVRCVFLVKSAGKKRKLESSGESANAIKKGKQSSN